MLTFLSSAKSFTGPTRDIQIRALRNWLAVCPGAEVILYGRMDGAEAVCGDLGVSYVPDIASSPSGVPYFNAIARHAAEHARHDTQVYVNCDILFSSSIARAIPHITFPQYLMIGQRIDLGDGIYPDASNAAVVEQLAALAQTGQATLHATSGKDYFIFSRGLWHDLLPTIIGRAGYDDALLAFCIRREIPIIDATFAILALHQYHDFNRVANKLTDVTIGKDAMFNALTHDVLHSAPDISDADWTLRNGELTLTRARGDKLRHAELYVRLRKGWKLPGYLLRGLWRALTALHLYTPSSPMQFTLTEVLEDYAKLQLTAPPSPPPGS